MSDFVTIAQTGSMKEVPFQEGMTVEEALRGAGITIGEGMQIRLNSAANDDPEAVLEAGDTILVVGEIRGALKY